MTDKDKIIELYSIIDRKNDVITEQAKQIDSLVDQVKDARNTLNAICEINEDV